MADDFTILPSDAGNTGDKVDTTPVTVAATPVVRQRIVVAGAAAAELADVKAAQPTSTHVGLVCREAPRLGDWSVTHAPAANTQATASKAAGGAGVQHVVTGLSVTLAGGAAAPTAALVTVNLRDGATGAGAILNTWTLAVEAVAGKVVTLSLSGLNVVGSANTACTLETSAAPGVNVSASVNLFGKAVTA